MGESVGPSWGASYDHTGRINSTGGGVSPGRTVGMGIPIGQAEAAVDDWGNPIGGGVGGGISSTDGAGVAVYAEKRASQVLDINYMITDKIDGIGDWWNNEIVPGLPKSYLDWLNFG